MEKCECESERSKLHLIGDQFKSVRASTLDWLDFWLNGYFENATGIIKKYEKSRVYKTVGRYKCITVKEWAFELENMLEKTVWYVRFVKGTTDSIWQFAIHGDKV